MIIILTNKSPEKLSFIRMWLKAQNFSSWSATAAPQREWIHQNSKKNHAGCHGEQWCTLITSKSGLFIRKKCNAEDFFSLMINHVCTLSPRLQKCSLTSPGADSPTCHRWQTPNTPEPSQDKRIGKERKDWARCMNVIQSSSLSKKNYGLK